MDPRPRHRIRAVLRRLRRFERRELRSLRRWLEDTRNLVQVSALLFVTFVVGLVTYLSNQLVGLSFLLYPPLASGAYTLFADPEGRYASPLKFVGGLTAGAFCGWLAILIVQLVDGMVAADTVSVVGAALAILLTGTVTWVARVEEPSAFSTALLTLFVQGRVESLGLYVLSVAAGSTLVAATFALWRRSFYERRAEYLYESTMGDDHVLVPMRGATADATAMLGARLAAAHDAGKVVLLDIVEEAWMAQAERDLLAEHGTTRLATGTPSGQAAGLESAAGDDQPDAAADTDISESVADLERRAQAIETQVGVPCQVIVAADGTSPAGTVRQAATQANCDLIAVPYESQHGSVTPFIQGLFRGDVDVLVHRSVDGRTDWRRIMVPVRKPGDVAHSMIDFALRLARKTGRVSVANCIDSEDRRRQADGMLENLVETFEGNIETRVSGAAIQEFLAGNAPSYDMIIIGASQDRSMASRLIAPPTFERLEDLECDVAIVDRG
ncbi:HPP family protein [Halobacteriales archaeon Cl-PHB]